MKKITIGILAHVDAGKTTLSEAMLYTSGNIKKLGRVDHQDAFLDTFSLEKERGITIFSKQARFEWKNVSYCLVDTPGHVDFSTEMERSLQVLDYAILVVNGTDGVQGHTETLWKLLRNYQIPTFLFVNKMDLHGKSKEELLGEIQEQFSENCISFMEADKNQSFYEEVAMCDETALENYMEMGMITEQEIGELIRQRKLFPCFFGAALKLDGVEMFMDAMSSLVQEKTYLEKFGARIYKIARDEQNTRLTYMKITGGNLKVKESILGCSNDKNGDVVEWEEKVNQIRLYSGEKYTTVNEIYAGEICAVTGLTRTLPGQSLGADSTKIEQVLQPVLTYKVELEEGIDPIVAYRKIVILEEEDPQLHIIWNEQLKEIHMQLMGEVQIDILKEMIKERFNLLVEFGDGNIVYKETIDSVVEGVGHFEPLRHYAEVHVILEPGEQGSGMQFDVQCSEDKLDKNWQRLVYTHFEEREHIGVLTGSVLTDMKITLVAGRAHNKHTEGGDFRQATYRAIRQGLKKAKSVLLEPYYAFTLVVPAEQLGRAMNDVQRMSGAFEVPDTGQEYTVLKGKAPVSEMRDYLKEVNAYTHGKGTLTCEVAGYFPCHNQEEVIEKIGYDSESDLENPTCSVFCAHGSGFLVPWDEVEQYMHVESVLEKIEEVEEINPITSVNRSGSVEQNEAELEKIYLREFGSRKKRFDDYGNVYYSQEERKTLPKPPKEKEYAGDPKYQKKTKVSKQQNEYLLVDGYNIIFSWEELRSLARENLDAARMKLLEIMCNYQGYRGIQVIVIFDAYKVKGGMGSVEQYQNIHVVFTKEAETADMYIEKVTHEIGKKYKVTVATSDGTEQVIIMQQGAYRMSAADLKSSVDWVNEQISDHSSHI